MIRSNNRARKQIGDALEGTDTPVITIDDCESDVVMPDPNDGEEDPEA